MTVCGEIKALDIRLNWVEAGAITWRRNKAAARPIVPTKAGAWVYAEDGSPALATFGDEVTICAGAHCVVMTVPTPTISGTN